MHKIKYALTAITLLLSTDVALARDSGHEPPVNASFLGKSGYLSVQVQKLANPKIIYADIPRAKIKQPMAKFLKDRWGWAKPTPSEPSSAYAPQWKTMFASFYGGNGLNNNLGEGRAAVSDDENFKGVGPTGMLNALTDPGHDTGTVTAHEGIIESIWSKLMSLELPFGAARVRGMIATRTLIQKVKDEPESFRVNFVRDDFLRPGHFIINPTAERVGRGAEEIKRVRNAILQLPNALPQPDGFTADNPAAKLKSGLNEWIDRMAVQAGYQWAHGIFAAAMSPTNVALSGAAADFGLFRALGGYPRLQLLHDARANGDSEEIVVLQEFHDSIRKHAPKAWATSIGNIADWEKRFLAKREQEIKKQMLYLAGAMTELIPSLDDHESSERLSDLLVRLAKAGNEKIIWEISDPYGTGTYNVPRVLNRLAGAEFNPAALEESLVAEVPEKAIRAKLAMAYYEYFLAMDSLASKAGISRQASLGYRKAAASIRNKKMEDMFSTPEFYRSVEKVVETYLRDEDESKVWHFIETKVNASRRNFRDAKPFTVVTSQIYDEVSGRIVREVYDARAGRMIRVVFNEITAMQKLMEEKMVGCDFDLSQ